MTQRYGKPVRKKLGLAALGLLAGLAIAAPVSAQRNGGPGGFPGGFPGDRGAGSFDIAYLNGLRVDHAQAHLRVNGFTKARNVGLDGRQWDLWFNREFREACAGFTSYNGTVTNVRFFTDAECGVGGTPTNSPDLRPRELEGLRVSDAQQRLRLSGYSKARSIDINGRQWDLWQSPRGRETCIGFTSYNGRITQVDGFRDRECSGDVGGRPGGGRPGQGWDRIEPRDLIRRRVGDAQEMLRQSGYIKARNIDISGAQWDLWYNERSRTACIGFTSYRGDVTDADTFRESSCRR